MHNLATVENRTVWASLAVRLKQISVAWTISILTVRVSLLRSLQSEPYLGSAALGITDEVEKLGLKGNKKRKSKKLDEDYMVLSHALILHPVSDHRRFLTARTQAFGREGYSKGRTGSPANAEQESAFQAPHSNKGALCHRHPTLARQLTWVTQRSRRTTQLYVKSCDCVGLVS